MELNPIFAAPLLPLKELDCDRLITIKQGN